MPAGEAEGNPASNNQRNGQRDHQLGLQIGSLIRASGGREFQTSVVLNQVQDLLGADTSLQGPMWDLVRRPAFRALFAGESPGVQRSRRDALVAELGHTYNTAVLQRLALLIDGCLGLPPGPPPRPAAGNGGAPGGTVPESGAPGTRAPGGRSPASAGSSSSWYEPLPASTPASGPYTYGSAPSSWPPYPVAPTPPQPSNGSQPLTALLIALVSLLTGAVLVGLGWMVMANRPPAQTPRQPATTTTSPPPPTATATPTPPSPAPPPPAPEPKSPVAITPPPSGGSAWGDASDYKFGTLPGGSYPNSCAFSSTDAQGRTILDKSRVDYWACRDVGGNPETGYSVVWADGKQTNYTFGRDGDGTVVGTNGSSYPMRWRNDSHRGSDIIVINHEDGATTWIPGRVR